GLGDEAERPFAELVEANGRGDEENVGLGDEETRDEENMGNTNPISSKPILLKHGHNLTYTALQVKPYESKNKADTTKNNSPWSVAFNPAVVLPSIHSIGKQGNVNYEKS